MQMKPGLVQMKMTADPKQNLEHAITKIREAAAMGANTICLPELFLTPYFCQTEDASWFDTAEAVPGPTTVTLSEVARELEVVIIASLFEKRARGLYHNTAAVIDADGVVAGIYRKMHIPDDPGFYEKYYFTPGDLGPGVFDTRYGRIGVLVCWDQWYPEAARMTAMRGADLIVYPTAIGWQPEEKELFGKAQREAWIAVQRGHAVANGTYIAAINRVGTEHAKDGSGTIEFWGSSFLFDPIGKEVALAGCANEEILIGVVDTDRIECIRRAWPFWRDRRIDVYGELLERYGDR